MEIFQSIFSARLVFILGIVNLVSAVLIFSSCRCIPGLAITGNLMKSAAYRRYYKYHCYIWWIFLPSVVVHTILAFAYFGVPG
jgi:hypothetical protein